MSPSTRVLRILGSALAGALGFGLGYYAGLFSVLSIWGLEVNEVWYPVFTVGFGSLFAGGAIAFTVKRSARVGAIITAVGLGAILIIATIAIDGALEMIIFGGLAIAVATSIVVRTRSSNTLFT